MKRVFRHGLLAGVSACVSRLARLAALSVLTLSCLADDQPMSPNAIDDAPPKSLSAVQQPRPDIVHIPRFALAIEVVDPILPRAPVRVRARVWANFATAQASMTVTFPEVTGFQRTPDNEWRVGDGPALPAATRRGTLAAGQEVVLEATQAVMTPGYYRAIITATGTNPPGVPADLRIVDIATEEVWFYLGDASGTATRAFDRRVFAGGELEIPGPRRLTSPAAGAVRPLAEACAAWRVLYADADRSNAHSPVPGARIDDAFASLLATTDANGRFQLCIPAGQTRTLNVKLLNADVSFNQPLIFATLTATSTTPGSDIIIDGPNARTFINLNKTIPASRALLGYSRSKVTVRVLMANSNSSYSGSDDRITMGSGGIWGQWGMFVAAHEYGHAVHERALGGIGPNNCPAPHNIKGAYTLSCAYGEGFADFHGIVTRGPDLGASAPAAQFRNLDNQLEGNGWYPGVLDQGSPAGVLPTDGSIIEGAVAAFLYDLVDGTNFPDGTTNQTGTDDDGVQFTGKYIADILRTCEIQYPATNPLNGPWMWLKELGVHELTFCFENRVDAAVVNSSVYFPTAGGFAWSPNAQRESATEPSGWSAAVIRTLWRRNLYGE